jgi:hypothetical protein
MGHVAVKSPTEPSLLNETKTGAGGWAGVVATRKRFAPDHYIHTHARGPAQFLTFCVCVYVCVCVCVCVWPLRSIYVCLSYGQPFQHTTAEPPTTSLRFELSQLIDKEV